MTQAEEIYHRFVQYEWNEISDSMKKSIIDAINEALRQPVVMRWRVVSGIMQGREFEGHPIVINNEQRIWDCGTVGNSYPSENCVLLSAVKQHACA